MIIPKKYRHRHRVLSTLQAKFQEGDRPDLIDSNDIELDYLSLVKKAGLSEQEISEQLDYLNDAGEIVSTERDFNYHYFISQKGTIAYHDRKYLVIGKREYRSDIYDMLKIISTIVLLVIAIVTFAINIFETRRNKSELDKLKVQVEELQKNSTVSNNWFSARNANGVHIISGLKLRLDYQ